MAVKVKTSSGKVGWIMEGFRVMIGKIGIDVVVFSSAFDADADTKNLNCTTGKLNEMEIILEEEAQHGAKS